MKFSIIVSTYNRPEALRLCLLSLFEQVHDYDEIIVGDDGSGPETKKLIDSMRHLCPSRLIHVYHEDNGFRLAMMRNKCVAVASNPYIIEVDGDVIPHKHFCEDHIYFARRGYYLKGGRVNLGEKKTEELCCLVLT